MRRADAAAGEPAAHHHPLVALARRCRRWWRTRARCGRSCSICFSNSIKFTGAGGQVIVSTALTERGEAILRVRDTGIGMTEKEIETAMEPFRQLATSTRYGSGGTGLGLPLTKALAEANRAAFSIKSAVDAGTLVEITFPGTQGAGGVRRREQRGVSTPFTGRVPAPRTTVSDRPPARALPAGRARGARYWCPRPAPRTCRTRCAATGPRGRSRNRW